MKGVAFWVSVTLVLAAACGDPASSPGGNGNSDAASIAIQSGNNQESAAATYVSVAPAVVIRNAQGAAVSGVSVTFSVIQGGGTILNGTTTSGADGIARVGAWKLGASSGQNQLRATVAGLAPVVFTAMAQAAPVQIASTSIPPAGGTITVNRPGNPLNGMTLTIPAGAFTTPTTWEFYSTPPDSIPGRTNIGFDLSFEVRTNAGFTEQPLLLRIPNPKSDITGTWSVYMYLQGTTLMEGIPSVADNGEIIIATHHFSADELAAGFNSTAATAAAVSRDGSIAGALATGIFKIGSILHRDESGVVKEAVKGILQTAQQQLQSMTSLLGASNITPFAPAVDDWEFASAGTVTAPFNIANGQAQTAIWYFNNLKNSSGALYGRFDQVDPIWEDNRSGVRWSAITQPYPLIESGGNVTGLLGPLVVGLLTFAGENKVFAQLAASFLHSRRPELIGLSDANLIGHAVVAYGTEPNKILIADPDFPGQARTLNFVNGVFQPYTGKYSGTSRTFTRFFRYGVTAMFSAAKLRQTSPAFVAGTAGDAEFPASTIEWKDGSTWRPIVNKKQIVWEDDIQLRSICATCVNKRPGLSNNQQYVIAYDKDGLNKREESAAANGTLVPLVIGTQKVGIHVAAYHPQALNNRTWLDFQWLDIVSSRLSIIPPNSTNYRGDPVTFTAVIEGEGPASRRFEWSFGDGKTATTTGASTVTTYQVAGTFTVTLRLFDNATGLQLTTATTLVTIVPPLSIWRITSLSIGFTTGTLPAESFNQPNLATYTTYFSIRHKMDLIMNGQPGYIHHHDGVQQIADQFDLDRDGDFGELISYPEEAWIQPGGLGFPAFGGERSHFPWLPSITMARREGWTITDFAPLPSVNNNGTLTAGSLNGRAYIEGTTPGGTTIRTHVIADVSATKNGTTILGTVTFTYRVLIGAALDKTWSVTYNFTGVLL